MHLLPCSIQSQSELTPELKKARRLEFAQWFLGKLETDKHFIQKIHITDECHVHLSRLVNKQNFRYWRADNPKNYFVNQSARSMPKETVWVAIGCNSIIGGCFFENDDGRTVTVDQINYRRMLEEFYLPELCRKAQRRSSSSSSRAVGVDAAVGIQAFIGRQ